MAVLNISIEGAEKTLLLNLGENTIRFIAAKSLTNTAQEVQSEIQKHIEDSFIIRKKSGGFVKSVKVLPAKKQKLEAKVYTMAGFAALQQTGGVSTAKAGRLAVPFYDDIRDVKSRTKSNSPQGLKDSFLIKLKSGGIAIAVRKKKELKIMYYLKALAYVPKRLNMLEIGEDTTLRRFPSIFYKNIEEISS